MKGDGYLTVGNDTVTWCFGHLLENAPPEHYDPKWARWDINTLPITVNNWILLPRRKRDNGKASDDPGVLKQIGLIKDLISSADEVINAGDPDREGQLLVDELLHYLGWKGKTRRLLLNATDPASVAKALNSMRDNADFYHLYESALCRSRADWLVGMNLTVAATKSFGNGKLISIGRVQTPTLAMVVRRDREIEAFKTAKYYYLIAKVDTGYGIVEMTFNPKENRITDKKLAEQIATRLAGQTVSLKVQKQVKTERAPLPYMLATWQKDAEEKLKLGAKESLEVLQELYEAKLSSYPRTERELLPPEQKPQALRVADGILAAGAVPEAVALRKHMVPSDRIYALPKEAEHHGIVPTGLSPRQDIPVRLKKAWEMICRRFLAGLLPDYRFEETVISFENDGRTFTAKGETPVNAKDSWVALYPREASALQISGTPTHGRVLDVSVKQGKTTPPRPYTEASLIADMVAIAKYVTDPKIKARLKETSGIGTPATRASIIETLKLRGYIEAKGKNINATDLGRMVVDRCPSAMTDPGTTAAWEEALSMVADAKMSYADFMSQINRFIERQIGKLISAGNRTD